MNKNIILYGTILIFGIAAPFIFPVRSVILSPSEIPNFGWPLSKKETNFINYYMCLYLLISARLQYSYAN